MLKLRVVFISLLVALAALAGFTLFRPLVTASNYSQVEMERLIQMEDGWVLQFSLFNHEDIDSNYVINVTIGNEQRLSYATVRSGGRYDYSHHIYAPLASDQVNLLIYRDGEASPLKQASYFLRQGYQNNG
jgi:hypothetical protein